VGGVHPAKSISWGVANSIVRARRTEETIVAVIREWSLLHPEIVVAHHRIMEYHRRERSYRKAWGSDPGKMKHGARMGEVPRTLWNLMKAKIRSDFWDHDDLVQAFFRHYRLGLMAPKTDRIKMGAIGSGGSRT
jgi:hypothetical protein